MSIYTLLKRYLHQYNCETQKQCRQEHGFHIRKDGTAWRLYVDSESSLCARFDDFVMFAYRYRFIVELPDNKWNIQHRDNWQYQLINIVREDDSN